MSLIQDFKEFVGSGNAIDLAVGVIIGSAISTILKSFVDELIVPLTGLVGKVSWADLYIDLKDNVPDGKTLAEARKIDGAVVLGYGQFLTVLVNTLVLALAVFLVVRVINKMKESKAKEVAAAEAAAPPPPPASELLLAEIRDLLKK